MIYCELLLFIVFYRNNFFLISNYMYMYTNMYINMYINSDTKISVEIKT